MSRVTGTKPPSSTGSPKKRSSNVRTTNLLTTRTSHNATPATNLPTRRGGGLEPALEPVLDPDHALEDDLEQHRRQQRDGERLGDDRGTYSLARLRTTT